MLAVFIHRSIGKGVLSLMIQAAVRRGFKKNKNSHQMPCGESQEMVGSSPAGAAACWHNAPAVAPGLTCCRRKISAAPSSSPGALMCCWIGGPSQSVISQINRKE